MSVIIAVGSKNPVKLNSALSGIQQALANVDPETISACGYNVSSGVSDQPIGDKETKTGATNRAKFAYDQYKAEHGAYPSD